MNRNSRAYIRARELDKAGFAEHLKRESAAAFEADSVSTTSSMGAVVTAVEDTLAGALSWMAPDLDDSEKFELDGNPPDSPAKPLDSDDESENEDSQVVKDPALIADAPQIQEALERVRLEFKPKKPPTFVYQVNPDQLIQFKAMINWFNQTSGVEYRSQRIDDRHQMICKISSVLQEPVPQVTFETPSQTDQQEKYTESEYSQAPVENPIEPDVSNANLSSTSRSAISILTKGILIPSKSKNKPKKKITLKSLGMTDNDLVKILTERPQLSIPEILKVAYTKKKSWSLVNNLYKVSDFQPIQ